MVKPSNDLSRFERAIMDNLLAGEHPALSVLREQLQIVRVSDREFTGVGFFTRLEVPGSPRRALALPDTVHITDVVAEIDGLDHGAGFVLYVTDGVLATLEGFTYDEPWPKEITNFSLTYMDKNRRDLAELGSDTDRA